MPAIPKTNQMEKRNRLGIQLMKLAGVLLLIRSLTILLYRLLSQIQNANASDEARSMYARLHDDPHWPWIVLAGLGVALIVGSARFGRLPKTESGSMDLSMPAIGVLVFLGASRIFGGLGLMPEFLKSGLEWSNYHQIGVIQFLSGLTILCFAPSITRCCRSVSLADLYSGGLRFSAAVKGLLAAALFAQDGSNLSFYLSPVFSANDDEPSQILRSYFLGIFSCLLIIAVMIRMSVVGWPWVSRDQPEGDFIAPIVSYSVLAAGLSLPWIANPYVLAVLTTLALLIGTSPQPIANLIRKLLTFCRPKRETSPID
jgi:hypothetical protein